MALTAGAAWAINCKAKLVGTWKVSQQQYLRICCLMHKRHRRALQIYLPTCIALMKMMPLFSSCHALKAIRSPCGAVTQTHTHTHTHAHMHARTHFFRNDEKGRVMLFSFFVFFFSLCLRVSLGSLAIHLVFSSCGTQAQTHHGTNKQTNKQTQTHSNHVCTCVLALRLVSRSLVCNNPAPRWTRMVVLSYTISWSSVHSYSVFLWALCSLSLSQVSHSVKLTRQSITGCYNTAAYKLTCVFVSSNL